MSQGLCENALKVLERRYLAKDKTGKVIETPDEMFRRVARAIASADSLYGLPKKETKRVEEEFYGLISNVYFMPNSPTLMNYATSLA